MFSVSFGLFVFFMIYSSGLKELFILWMVRLLKEVVDFKCFKFGIYNCYIVVIFVVDLYWYFF